MELYCIIYSALAIRIRTYSLQLSQTLHSVDNSSFVDHTMESQSADDMSACLLWTVEIYHILLVGSYLSPKEYHSLSVTCSELRRGMTFQQDDQDTNETNEHLLYASANANQILLRQSGVTFFGSDEWKATFGIELQKVPLLDLSIFRTLHTDCPFNTDGRKVKDTHALVYIPKKIDESNINMELLSLLCPQIVQDPDPAIWGGYMMEAVLAEDQPDGVENPDDSPGIPQYDPRMNWIDCGIASDMTVSKSCWMLFYIGDDHSILPNTRGKSFSGMVEGLRKVNSGLSGESGLGRNGELLAGEGYEVLSALEVAVMASLIVSKTGQRILPSEPSSFSLTRYYTVDYNRTIIGDNNEGSGLFGWYALLGGSESIGICAGRRLATAVTVSSGHIVMSCAAPR